ncbi:hypothetical protein FACS1894199_15030 [Bacteroidia bacterium]|nr:hypothetical protein FACS1894199_15030 [Bacteroidia bacterium]
MYYEKDKFIKVHRSGNNAARHNSGGRRANTHARILRLRSWWSIIDTILRPFADEGGGWLWWWWWRGLHLFADP